jgi:hypothetical protein
MRFFVALAITATCAITMFHGWRIASFAHARMQATNSHDGQPADLTRWFGAPGITAAALEASLPNMTDATDIEGARARERRVEEIAAVRPLSASTWLALAGLRLVTGAPYRQVLDALAMSSIAGPNEAGIMLQRGIFGLLQWENLPTDARRRTITDLSGVLLSTTIQDEDILPAKNVLREKSTQTRHEVADLLRDDGVPASEITRLGL